jgi:hypothetical protein
MAEDYAAPVDRLLPMGERAARQGEWPDYLQLGLTAADVPELIRLATDEELHLRTGSWCAICWISRLWSRWE